MHVLHINHLAQVLQRLFSAMTQRTVQIHELIVLNKAFTFNLAEIFKEGNAAKS